MGLLSAARRGIRAFHGSPHDFDRFDLRFIGRGEGNQTYGHGLYFAEAEDVARGYRERLSTPVFEVPQGLSHDATAALREMADTYDNKLSRSEFNAVLRDMRSHDDVPSWVAELDDAANRGLIQFRDNPGRMYEVRINAEPEEFLDWDALLSGQGQRIQEAFRGVPQAPDIPGQLAYYRMAGRRLQSPETSARLRDAGIPGIRYLDGNSRSAGDGSRNYVVFDDSLIEILRKYGIVGLGTGGMAALANGRQQQGA